MELGVGRLGLIGSATALPIDRSTNASNRAISSLQVSARADAISSPMMAHAITIKKSGGIAGRLDAGALDRPRKILVVAQRSQISGSSCSERGEFIVGANRVAGR